MINGPVWAFSESAKGAREVIAAANSLARSLSVPSVLIELDATNRTITGAEKRLVLRADKNLSGCSELAAEALSRAYQARSPSIVLVAATREGREVASMLAVKTRRGCLSEASGLRVDGGILTGARNVYSGRGMAEVSADLPCLATVKLGAYQPLDGKVTTAEITDIGSVAQRVSTRSSTPKQAEGVDLQSAKVVVSAGRGFKKKEDLAMVEQLARAMGGAVGCSRPLSSDYGWLPEDHHIGLTGVTVRPLLYLALGISGQLQHVAGIKDSKVIAAVNTDRGAPIFEAADYGVVGNIYELIPVLLELLRTKNS